MELISLCPNLQFQVSTVLLFLEFQVVYSFLWLGVSHLLTVCFYFVAAVIY